MDLEKNIEIAFEVYWKNLPVTTELNTGTHSDAFIAGAKSQAAKDFWYNEFKRERKPVILDEYSFFDNELFDLEFIKELMHESSVNKKPFIVAADNGVQSSANMTENIILLKKCVGGPSTLVKNLPRIESTVPIVDVVPEPIMSKKDFLEMHDKAVESAIANETFKESRAWDIKKQKKVSHKRNNKRK